MVTSIDQLMGLHYRVEWLDRAYQAYLYEDPSIAIWALESVRDVLMHDAGKPQFIEDKKTIMTDLALTHTRLALSFHRLRDQEKYQENLNSAVNLSKQYCRDDWHTKDALINMVTKLDNSNKEKSQNHDM